MRLPGSKKLEISGRAKGSISANAGALSRNTRQMSLLGGKYAGHRMLFATQEYEKVNPDSPINLRMVGTAGL